MRSLQALWRDDGKRARSRSRRCARRSPAASTGRPCSTRCRPVPPATPSTARCGTWRPRSAERSVAAAIWRAPRSALETAYTLSLGEPEAMAAQARANAARPLLKVKIGGDNDIARIRAVSGSGTRQPHHPRRQRRLDRRQHRRKPRVCGGAGHCADRAAAAGRQGRDPAPYRASGADLRRRERA